MYTQCPECESAFRVTAEVLKQAGGMVRCGSCGSAFNSLEYLSEQKPAPRVPEPSIPELKPEPPESEPTSVVTDVPKSISAEQSAALLKTLDQLAGDDIRIEDTGVEWRVLGADEDEQDGDNTTFDPSQTDVSHLDADTEIDFSDTDDVDENLVESENTGIWIVGDSKNLEDAAAATSDDPTATIVDEPELFEGGSTRVDELLDETPTPVDEVLEASGGNIQNAELFQTQMMGSQPTEESAELFRTQEIDTAPQPEHADLFATQELAADAAEKASSDVMRFDDNTPLPEDFLDDESPVDQAGPVQESLAVDVSPPPVDVQNQFALSEPDEWEQLLDEFDDLLGADVELPAGSNGSAGAAERGSDDDSIEAELISAAFENDQSAADQGSDIDSSIEEDLMSAAFDFEAEDDGAADTAVSDLAEANAELGDVLDEASRLAESLDDESGRFNLDADDESDADDRRRNNAGDASIAEELEALGDEPEGIAEDEHVDEAADVEPEELKALEDEPEAVAEADNVDEDSHAELQEQPGDAPAVEQDEPAELAADAAAEQLADEELADEESVEYEPAAEGPIDAAADAGAEEADDDEQEKLDLEGMLEPDDEGLVDEGESDREPSDDDLPELHDVGDRPKSQHDIPPMTEEEETINMLIDQDLLAIAQVDDDGFASTIVVEKEAAPVKVETVIIGELDEDQPSDDDSAESVNPEHARSGIFGLAAAKTEDGEAAPSRGRSIGIVAAAVVLAIALAGQLVHQNRDALATNAAFGSVLNPVYEMLGMPITPDWDVGGWDIARTQGATDEQDQLLTIFSEIRNTSDTALPYPIVTLSLTDRYQDPIGALILEPADYLADGINPVGKVPPGGRFEAVIPIDEPSPDAIGYTINACYRTPGSDLRCAIADFK